MEGGAHVEGRRVGRRAWFRGVDGEVQRGGFVGGEFEDEDVSVGVVVGVGARVGDGAWFELGTAEGGAWAGWRGRQACDRRRVGAGARIGVTGGGVRGKGYSGLSNVFESDEDLGLASSKVV